MQIEKINNRDLVIWFYNDGLEFINRCKDSIETCRNNYSYRITECPVKITKDIRDIIKSKKEFYCKIITVYYDDDCVYYVQYGKNKILLDIYTEEGKGCAVAHAITRIKKEKKNVKETTEVL